MPGQGNNGNGNGGGPSLTDGKDSEISFDKKWIKFEVPDYDGGTAGQQSSYLRIGANDVADPQADANRPNGEDLAALADHTFSISTSSSDPRTSVQSQKNIFWDDDRTNPNNASGQKTISQELHRTGGWRDHTDGNRITTTRGDKVEVIGGNYRLLVLGRTGTRSSGYSDHSGHVVDSSGGILQDIDQTSYAVTEVKWVNKEGGTWMVKTSGSKGDYYSVTHGFHKDTHHGDMESTHTGDVTSIQTGDTDETQTGDVWSKQYGLSNSVAVGGETSSWTAHGESISGTAFAASQAGTFGISSNELSIVAQQLDLSMALLRTSIELAGAKSDIFLGGSYSELRVAGSHIECNVGSHIELTGADKTELSGIKKVLAIVSFFG